ncbi:DUF4214 domain-containing protein [Methylobacterium isbiliense]|jgi:hypothetical protein|uniref:DUF4214 domain-containing protein n=1 Tax=Methylobacterium isbiliense TaxID=315478 RepID=A0ABQ4SGB6_9HYPH|nr:DUF4214 domain-containing protein [Methylobacterium isbiliense]MDN3624242.1 DUF4214 domain-containing protein [Methylobacterium isbiliense]GJE02277.1 hypothetical protein GMJLKIPL_4221 [Methylobacterium isbiliense]
MDHSKAQLVAGELYGKILLRNADPDGFAYVIDRLTNGMSPLDIANEFMRSEEFADKFLLNTSPNEIARKLLIAMFGKIPSPAEIKQNSLLIVNRGVHAFVDKHMREKKLSLNDRLPDLRKY